MISVSLRNVSKKFDNIIALRNVSLEVKEREVYGLVGPNGAGKTTLLKIISGLLYPDSGEVYVNGFSLYENRVGVMESTLLILSDPWYSLMGYLTPFENLYVFGRLKGLNKKEAKERALEALKKVGLLEKAYENLGRLSDGQRARVALAKLFVVEPPIALLDEPTREIDPLAAKKIRKLIKDYIRETGSTVILSSHLMSEVEEICSTISIINEGQILLTGSVEYIKSRISPKFSVVVFDVNFLNIVKLRNILEKANCILHYFYKCYDSVINGYEFKVFTNDVDSVIDLILNLFKSKVFTLRRIEVRSPTLEDAYLVFLKGVFHES